VPTFDYLTRIRSYRPFFKQLRFYQFDCSGNLFFAPAGRWKFNSKRFHGRKVWLLRFYKRFMIKRLMVKPTLIRGKKKRPKFSHIFSRFRLKQFIFALREPALRRYVRLANANLNQSNLTMFQRFLQSLESRLDVLIYRLGFFPSSAYVKKLIVQNKIRVNFLPIKYPSYSVKVGDRVSFTFSLFPQLLKLLFSLRVSFSRLFFLLRSFKYLQIFSAFKALWGGSKANLKLKFALLHNQKINTLLPKIHTFRLSFFGNKFLNIAKRKDLNYFFYKKNNLSKFLMFYAKTLKTTKKSKFFVRKYKNFLKKRKVRRFLFRFRYPFLRKFH